MQSELVCAHPVSGARKAAVNMSQNLEKKINLPEIIFCSPFSRFHCRFIPTTPKWTNENWKN